MKCILYHDLSQIFRIRKKMLFGYFSSILFLMIFVCILKIPYMDIFCGILGLKFYKYSPLFVVSYLLNRIFFICIIFCLFTYDFKNSKGNLFTRLMPSKWMLLKISSGVIITVILRIIIYLIIMLIMYLFNGNIISISSLFQYFLIDIFYFLFIQFSSLFLYFLFQYKLLLGIFLLLIYFIFNSFFIADLSFYLIWFYIIVDFIFILLHVYFFKNQYVILFERSADY